MQSKIELTPYLSQKIRNISLLAIIMVFIQHGSYGLPNTGIQSIFKHLVSFGIADYPVSFFFIVSGYFLSRKFAPTFSWYLTELKKRSISLLVPYLIYIFLGFWLFDCSSHITILDGLGVTSLLPAVGPLWYIRTLILLCLLSPIIISATTIMARHTFCRYIGFGIFLSACLIAFPARKSLGMSTLYFSFGTFLAVYGSCFTTISTKFKCYMCLSLLFTALCFKLYHITHFPICDTDEVYLRWLVIPFTIGSIWYGYDLLFKNCVIAMPRWLEFSSETTFFAYCVESFVRLGLNKAIYASGHQQLANTSLGIVFSALVIASIGFVIARLLQLTIPKFYTILSGGR